MGYPQDPYGQQHQPYGQGNNQSPVPHYQPQPYSQPYPPAPSGPQYGPVQYTTVKERGFNPVALIIHGCAWVFVHWWMVLLTLGLWLIVAIPVSFIGWRVTRHLPVQQVHHQQPPYPPHLPPTY
jgi:hypothetical protein